MTTVFLDTIQQYEVKILHEIDLLKINQHISDYSKISDILLTTFKELRLEFGSNADILCGFKNDYNCDITYGMDTSNLILITVRIEDYSCDIMKILDKISDNIDIINDTPIMVLLTTDFRYKK